MCMRKRYILLAWLLSPPSCFGWVAPRRQSAIVHGGKKRENARPVSGVLRMSGIENVDDYVFPISTRQALIQKAQSLDSSLAEKKEGSYSSRGWSNRLGTVLTPASIPNVYTADRPFMWNNIDVGCRMTVIVLNDKNEIWVHSPVALDGPLQQALHQLGTVTHVVSPNYEHVKFASQWAKAYPDAKMWACPGLAEREPQVRWDGEVPFGIRPASWAKNGEDDASSLPEGFWDTSEIQPLHIDCEVNPFTGKPFFNEVIFYHSQSKTLLATDFYWNYPKGDGVTNSNFNGIGQEQQQDLGVWELAPAVDKVPFGSRLWKVGMDKIFRPFYLNLMIQKPKRDEFNDIAKFVCGGGWDVETVIPAHGDIVRGKGLVRTVLQKHFNL